jgi:hypothetical protein
VKVGNYIVAIIVDVCSGMLLLYWLTAVTSSPSQLLLESGEVCTVVISTKIDFSITLLTVLPLYTFQLQFSTFYIKKEKIMIGLVNIVYREWNMMCE